MPGMDTATFVELVVTMLLSTGECFLIGCDASGRAGRAPRSPEGLGRVLLGLEWPAPSPRRARSSPVPESIDILRGEILLAPEPCDLEHHNPHERAFIAAARAWVADAAFVDVLLDLAQIAREWESEGGEPYRADDLLRLRDEWMKREDPETYADEVRDGRFRPR